jgi:hypothetical protein
MSTPIGSTTTGESWEVVEHSRNAAARELDNLIAATLACDCDNGANSLKHYDVISLVVRERYPAYVLPGLVAAAVTRLAGIKAGER